MALARAFDLPDLETLQQAFDQLAHADYNGVKGVVCMAAEKPGPAVGISICTHGNEPAGLAAFWYFTQIAPLLNDLEKGSVFFVLNNLQAAVSYWQATTEEHKRNTRYLDVNMNRLPEETMDLKDDLRYEIRRAQELHPLWQHFDVGIDLHSTSQEAPPMLVTNHDLDFSLVQGFPMKNLITNVGNVMSGHFVTDFYGKNKTCHSMLVECGQHESPSSYKIAIESVIALLRNLGMRDDTLEDGFEVGEEFDHYHVEDAFFLPDESYKLERVFPNFEPVKRGDIVARGNQGELRISMDGHSLMCPDTVKPPFLDEEVMFISRPVERLRVAVSN